MQELDYQTTLSQITAPATVCDRSPRLLPVKQNVSWMGNLLAILIAAAYFFFIFQYWAPAHPGVDQNGYLVGGKNFARTFTSGYIPREATGFVSTMWVRVPSTGMNYPKYPLGLPLLYSIILWACGDSGVQWAYLISPAGAALGVLGIYFLARRFAGVFASISAMLLLAFGQVTLALANNPNSHGSCLACVVWGGYFLVRFWQSGNKYLGFLGGFLLGYAATIRYSEGLLGILILVVMLSMIRWRSLRTYLQSAWPLVGWIIPVGLLVAFNLVAMGSPTGYDSTNESKPGSAFTIEHIDENWEKLIRLIHDTGMFFIAPLAILGMLLAYRKSVRLGLLLTLWFAPGVALYMSYYWAPEKGVSYLRFFLTLIPPALVGAAIVMDELLRRNQAVSRRRFAIAAPIACGAVVALSCLLGLYRAIFGLDDGVESPLGLESQLKSNANLVELGRLVRANIPRGSAIFSGQAELNHIQFVGDYDLFCREYYTTSYVTRLRKTEETTDPEDPITTQHERRQWLLDCLENKNDKQLNDLQVEIINRYLGSGKRVFVVMTRAAADTYAKQVLKSANTLELKVRATYSDMPLVTTYTEPVESKNKPAKPGGILNTIQKGVARARDVQQTWQIAEIVRAAPKPVNKNSKT